jgi:hypothetical protein
MQDCGNVISLYGACDEEGRFDRASTLRVCIRLWIKWDKSVAFLFFCADWLSMWLIISCWHLIATWKAFDSLLLLLCCYPSQPPPTSSHARRSDRRPCDCEFLTRAWDPICGVSMTIKKRKKLVFYVVLRDYPIIPENGCRCAQVHESARNGSQTGTPWWRNAESDSRASALSTAAMYM